MFCFFSSCPNDILISCRAMIVNVHVCDTNYKCTLDGNLMMVKVEKFDFCSAGSHSLKVRKCLLLVRCTGAMRASKMP